MIYFLYDILLLAATPLIFLYAFVRSRRKGRRREGIAERFGYLEPAEFSRVQGKGPIWVHAVSVGETMAVKPLLRALKDAFPQRPTVLSHVTETGRSVAEKLNDADLCVYFPFDYRFAVRRALNTVKPVLVIIVETEIWPNFLRTAREMGIPAVMVNGRISDRSFGRYLKLRWFFRPVLANVTAFCMQTDEDARRIVAMGAEPERVHVTKNLKYDIPLTIPSHGGKGSMKRGYGIPEDVLVVTAGSTHHGEEEEVVAAYEQILSEGLNCFMVLVPRHPERAGEVAGILKNRGIPFTLRSRLDKRGEPLSSGEVLLVDTVGELMRLYSLSDVVFVGGSLVPTGGHNLLEPAACGVPVIFGPHMDNFREIASLVLRGGGGMQVDDGAGLRSALRSLLTDSGRRAAMGEDGARLILDNSGSTARHMEVISTLMRDET